jgi:Spy/CpxP family protein refolding chaperone
MNKLLFLAMAGAAILLGQDVIGPVDRVLLPRPVPQHDVIQQFLVLTPDQMQKLQSIVQTRNEAERAVWTQISAKQTELHRLLESGSTDALTIGRLQVDIRDLQKQVPGNSEPYMRQALQILTDPQKAKLAELSKALELQNAAHQAVFLNLLPPRAPDVRILPMPILAERSATLHLGQ